MPDDDADVFSFSEYSGVQSGPSLPLQSAAACLPKDFNRSHKAVFSQSITKVSWMQDTTLPESILRKHEGSEFAFRSITLTFNSQRIRGPLVRLWLLFDLNEMRPTSADTDSRFVKVRASMWSYRAKGPSTRGHSQTPLPISALRCTVATRPSRTTPPLPLCCSQCRQQRALLAAAAWESASNGALLALWCHGGVVAKDPQPLPDLSQSSCY